jgi:hypothetical protein
MRCWVRDRWKYDLDDTTAEAGSSCTGSDAVVGWLSWEDVVKKRLVELADYEINALLMLISLGDEHPRIDLTLESGMLTNERWWREYDKKTDTIQGDLMRVSIDLVSLGDRLKEVKCEQT